MVRPGRRILDLYGSEARRSPGGEIVRREPRSEVGHDPPVTRGNKDGRTVLQGAEERKGSYDRDTGTACVDLGTAPQTQDQEREALAGGYKDDDLVFARPDGSFAQPWNYASAVTDLAPRAKVKSISLHDVRDTHASLLAKNGVPLEVVSKRLGHSSIGVTAERYLHVDSDRDAAAANVLDTLCG